MYLLSHILLRMVSWGLQYDLGIVYDFIFLHRANLVLCVVSAYLRWRRPRQRSEVQLASLAGFKLLGRLVRGIR